MDILSSSKLIYSRYSECITLLHPSTLSTISLTTSTKTTGVQRKTERVSIRKKKDVNSHEAKRDDIAFLSSVQTPSEVCLALACVARPRHCDNNNNNNNNNNDDDMMMMNRDNRMLVFVPYDIPRDEIFVEMPLSAFKAARDPTRGCGLQLMVLNEYSLLCSRTKDGLPPRKGLFITFRTAKTQQRFREALDDLICNNNNNSNNNNDDYDYNNNNNNLVFNTSDPVKRLNQMVQTREDNKIRVGTTPTSGAIIPRGSTHTTVTKKRSWQKEEENENENEENEIEEENEFEKEKEFEESRGAMSLINNLLRDRDRRREAYMASIGKPTRQQSYLTGLTPTSSLNKGETDNNIEFSKWAQEHQKLNPTTWNILAGAAESQMMSENQTVKDRNSLINHPHHISHNSNVVLSQYNVPTLNARAELLHEIRTAMETVDKMNKVQGNDRINLLGTTREFIRQHQEDLWRLEQGENVRHSSPPSLLKFKYMNDDTLSPVAATLLQQQQQQQIEQEIQQQKEEEKEKLSVREVFRESIRPRTPPLTSQTFNSMIPKQAQKEMVLETLTTGQDVKTTTINTNTTNTNTNTTPLITSESSPSSRHPVDPPVVAVSLLQESQVKLQKELQVARETESRILSTLHKAPPKIIDNKQRVFGTIPKTSVHLQLSPNITVKEKNVSNEIGNGNVNVASSTTVASEIPSLVQLKSNHNKDASGVTSQEPIIQEVKKEEKEKETPLCGEGWKTVRDPASGKNYFVHTATKRTTWNISDTFNPNSNEQQNQKQEKDKHEEKDNEKKITKCGTGWRAVSDPSTGRTYYVNKTTKSTTWKVEDTFEEGKSTSIADNQTTEKQKSIKTSSSVWGEREDSATGKVYYYNKKTKQTTWKRSDTDLDAA